MRVTKGELKSRRTERPFDSAEQIRKRCNRPDEKAKNRTHTDTQTTKEELHVQFNQLEQKHASLRAT